jgi:hypothetical protein
MTRAKLLYTLTLDRETLDHIQDAIAATWARADDAHAPEWRALMEELRGAMDDAAIAGDVQIAVVDDQLRPPEPQLFDPDAGSPRRAQPVCPHCERVMSYREADEQDACNDCFERHG